MNQQELGKYITSKQVFSIPELQKEFNLSYSFVRSYIEELIQREKIKKLDEFQFSFIKNETDLLYIYALWLTIQNSNFSIGFFQSKFNLDEEKINAIIDWMKEKEYVKTRPFSTVKITKEKFLNLYAPLDVDCEAFDAFLNWKKENEKEVKKYLKVEPPKKPFSDKEYYDTLENQCKENPKGSQEEFIAILAHKCHELKDDVKMNAIFIKMIGEISSLNEKQFQSLREVILS